MYNEYSQKLSRIMQMEHHNVQTDDNLSSSQHYIYNAISMRMIRMLTQHGLKRIGEFFAELCGL
ncbi:MAG: hypothetical protein FMNOHCHN_03079 [Ignavibacteriaceae bacterium]|nr:hypothetical protein [Ignavibacteriaceae bacterium]